MQFTRRLLDAACECRDVSQLAESVNIFGCGLLEATGERTLEQMRHLPLADRGNVIMLRKISSSDGITHRAPLSSQKALVLSNSRIVVTKTNHPFLANIQPCS